MGQVLFRLAQFETYTYMQIIGFRGTWWTSFIVTSYQSLGIFFRDFFFLFQVSHGLLKWNLEYMVRDPPLITVIIKGGGGGVNELRNVFSPIFNAAHVLCLFLPQKVGRVVGPPRPPPPHPPVSDRRLYYNAFFNIVNHCSKFMCMKNSLEKAQTST